MSELDHHAMFAAELSVWQKVVDHLPERLLLELRGWLNQPDQLALADERAGLRLLVVDVLEVACRRLVSEFGWPAAHLVASGDMAPAAPDDVSSLTEDGGPGGL